MGVFTNHSFSFCCYQPRRLLTFFHSSIHWCSLIYKLLCKLTPLTFLQFATGLTGNSKILVTLKSYGDWGFNPLIVVPLRTGLIGIYYIFNESLELDPRFFFVSSLWPGLWSSPFNILYGPSYRLQTDSSSLLRVMTYLKEVAQFYSYCLVQHQSDSLWLHHSIPHPFPT